MPATGKVSLTIQTIFCFFPILELYAAYNIKKLRRYLTIMIPVGMISGLFSQFISYTTYYQRILDSNEGISAWTSVDANYTIQDNFGTLYLIYLGCTYVVAAYFIRKWSKKWNKSVEV